MVHLSKLIDSLLLIELETSLRFHSFFHKYHFYCSKNPPWDYANLTSLLISALFSWSFFFFFSVIIVTRSIGQIFFRMSLSLDLSGVFLMTAQVLLIWEKKTTELNGPCHHTISRGLSRYYQYGLSLAIRMLTTWLGWGLKSFTSVMLKLFSFHIPFFGSRSLNLAHTQDKEN